MKPKVSKETIDEMYTLLEATRPTVSEKEYDNLSMLIEALVACDRYQAALLFYADKNNFGINEKGKLVEMPQGLVSGANPPRTIGAYAREALVGP